MMSFPQPSLVPTVIALSEFFIDNFPNIWWYPHWYLGNPFNFLIGPVVPMALFITSKVFILNISKAYLVIIFISQIIGSLSLYILVRDLGGAKRIAILSSILFLFMPFGLILLSVSNGLHHVGFGFISLVFLCYRRWVSSNSPKYTILISLLIAFLLLIDISILLPVVIGFVSLLIVLPVEKKKIAYIAIKSFFLLLAGLLLATLWYTPKFWFFLLSNPSFGGIPLGNLLKILFDLVLQLLPIVLAVLVVKWRKEKPSPLLLFALAFLASFAFLTLVRFSLDPDFVLDWIGFLLEIQFGLSILVGLLLARLRWFFIVFILLTIVDLLVVVQLFTCSIVDRGILKQFNNAAIQQCGLLGSYQNRITDLLANHVKRTERVFLSGSSVFWINYITKMNQVRGGNDSSAIHPYWAQGAYQIREGKNSVLAKDWLAALGASYILVQKEESDEYFSDFKHIEKYRDFMPVVASGADILLKVPRGWLGRVAAGEILRVDKPSGGADGKSLRAYVGTFQKPVDIFFDKPNSIRAAVDLKSDEVLLLAVTYDSSWKLKKGEGRLSKDPIGNMVFIPQVEGVNEIVLGYDKGITGSLLSFLLFLGLVSIFLFYDRAYFGFERLFVRLGFGSDSQDD